MNEVFNNKRSIICFDHLVKSLHHTHSLYATLIHVAPGSLQNALKLLDIVMLASTLSCCLSIWWHPRGSQWGFSWGIVKAIFHTLNASFLQNWLVIRARWCIAMLYINTYLSPTAATCGTTCCSHHPASPSELHIVGWSVNLEREKGYVPPFNGC